MPGACLMIPSGPNEHLFVVALGPVVVNCYGREPQVVMVGLSSIKPGLRYDKACEIRAGSHPFVIRDSFVYYREPQIASSLSVENNVNSNVWRPKPPCSNDMLQRILAGFHLSGRLPRYVKEMLDQLSI